MHEFTDYQSVVSATIKLQMLLLLQAANNLKMLLTDNHTSTLYVHLFSLLIIKLQKSQTKAAI